MAKLPSQGIRFSDAAIRREGLMKKKKKIRVKLITAVICICILFLFYFNFLNCICILNVFKVDSIFTPLSTYISCIYQSIWSGTF